LAASVQTEPEKRRAQRDLARHLTALFMARLNLRKLCGRRKFFSARISGWVCRRFLDIFADVPSTDWKNQKLDGFTVTDALVALVWRLPKARPGAWFSGGVCVNTGESGARQHDLCLQT